MKKRAYSIYGYHSWVLRVIKSCVTDEQLNGAQRLLPLFIRMFKGKISESTLDLFCIEQLSAVKSKRQPINNPDE